ncbi:hypothetical protein CEXT_331741 [Caerostris extrusa]|uniref:Uncharacterized protein n=1 Tax=Caerostris extrusa TaxID=172846 RepID=A0AAV4TEL7_CAEEX|nr:hypothetical protein CEXT_331741 [Caerostris extrusa]
MVGISITGNEETMKVDSISTCTSSDQKEKAIQSPVSKHARGIIAQSASVSRRDDRERTDVTKTGSLCLSATSPKSRDLLRSDRLVKPSAALDVPFPEFSVRDGDKCRPQLTLLCNSNPKQIVDLPGDSFKVVDELSRQKEMWAKKKSQQERKNRDGSGDQKKSPFFECSTWQKATRNGSLGQSLVSVEDGAKTEMERIRLES